MVDSHATHLRDVEEAVDSAEVDECAVICQSSNGAFKHVAGGNAGEEILLDVFLLLIFSKSVGKGQTFRRSLSISMILTGRVSPTYFFEMSKLA